MGLRNCLACTSTVPWRHPGARGAKHSVKTSADLQKALNAAQCGDTISLQAGSAFTGLFTFPAKQCDDAHWIVVRSSAADSALPPEGTRATPCYAGTASLPGRRSLGCSNASNVLAKLAFAGTGSGPVVFAPGANHYRLLGLEITHSTPNMVVYNLVSNQSGGTSDHIGIDRSWLHGTAQDETTRGVMLSGSTYFAIVDSFFSDFHCFAVTGSCGDSQAIAGGLGTNAMGPYKIANNFLEAAAENLLFGGGAADQAPHSWVFRNFSRRWRPLTPLLGFPRKPSPHPLPGRGGRIRLEWPVKPSYTRLVFRDRAGSGLRPIGPRLRRHGSRRTGSPSAIHLGTP